MPLRPKAPVAARLKRREDTPPETPLEQSRRSEFGDFQTHLTLARAVLERVAVRWPSAPAAVLEPTCGVGAFLVAAAEKFPAARLLGYDVDERHVAAAQTALRGCARASVAIADFFEADWGALAQRLPEPVLLVGNPPWVTNSGLGVIESRNLPPKARVAGHSGIDSITGKANFDISEWILLRLIEAFAGKQAMGAMLIKTAVARRILVAAEARGLPFYDPAIYRIDAARHFGVAVDACLLCWSSRGTERDCGVYVGLDATQPSTTIGVREGQLVADVAGFAAARAWLGRSERPWRSGLKHDCAAVMELAAAGDGYRNGLGEVVRLDEQTIFPLLKSSDLANGREARKWVIVPQRAVRQETQGLERSAPLTWRYLARHGARLDARRSAIYRGQPRFSVFGVGEYSFRPWKVAISGMYKRGAFALVGPVAGRPVMLDDTCYFLAFDDEQEAREAWRALSGERAQKVLAGLVFWEAKRPITKDVLMRLELGRLLAGSEG